MTKVPMTSHNLILHLCGKTRYLPSGVVMPEVDSMIPNQKD